MHQKYFLATLLLIVAGIPVAEAEPLDNSTAVPVKNAPEPVKAPATPVLTDQPMFKFGGFGSVGVSHSSQNQGDYVLESSMPKGAGRSSDWWFGNNTRAAAHVTAKFTPEVSAVFQVDSEYRSDGSYSPEVEWLYVKYAFTPNVFMRVGRIALPTFIDSENHDVGYSYVWVNPPVDLYRQLPISSSDGVDVVFRSEIGEVGNSFKAIYGTSTHDRPGSVATSEDMWGIFDTVEFGQASFHVSYQQRRESTRNLQTGVTGPWTRNTDLSVGASYDPGDWFVISEWIQRRSTYKIGAMYVSGGYRIDKFTPYLAYSQNSPGSFFPDAPAPTAAAIERANRAQSTTSLGMRWDFMRNYDFKIQYDQVKLSDTSNGYLINVPAGVTLHGSKFYVISAVVDFVF
ncbi:MAG: porin [Nitrosomonadales bacterium]|nr:porin [Nitrosomonadales bacterium]